MKWQNAEVFKEEHVQIPGRWLFLHYYEALTILFRIENALRIFVYVTFKKHFHDKWLDQNVTSDDERGGTISSLAKQRMGQTSTFGYLGYATTCPVMYLTGGELIRLITSDAYWKYFKHIFPASKEIVKNKLDEIGNIRNSLAHFRAIKNDDVEVLKQNAKHIMTNIEHQLWDMVSTRTTVPTNTNEQWYGELRPLGTDLCTLQFTQTSDAEWIKVKINYNCPIISRNTFGKVHFYKLLTINGPEILKNHLNLAKLSIYMTESVPPIFVANDGQGDFKKTVSITFTIDDLRNSHSQIKEDLEQILVTISNETELIQQDNLARGKIVSLVGSSARIEKDREITFAETSELVSPMQKTDPPEWWGELTMFVSDFISSTHRYPWMPTNIAKAQFP